MKRFLAVFLMLAILLTSVSLTAMAADPDGWKKGAEGWQYIQGGKPVADKWIQDGGYWYYIGADTYMLTNDVVFSFDQFGEVNGAYYLKPNGQMLADGWADVTIEYEGTEGKHVWKFWAYARGNGKLAMNEWVQYKGSWFYFDGISMVENDVLEIGGKYYWFKPNGEMVVGWYQPWKENDTWVYGLANGQLATGWQLINKKWYYFGDYDDWGILYNGVFGIKIKDKEAWDIYAAGKDGAMISNAWYEDKWQDPEDGTVYSDWYYLTDSGKAAKGWVNVSGKWYYMDPDWAFMWTGWICVKDINYHMDEKSGAMTIGWFKFDGAWYYFKDSGAMARNEWLQINGKWYYFDNDGQMLSNGTYVFTDSKTYTFDANGVWVK